MTKQGRLEFDAHVTHASQGDLVYVTLDNNVEMLAKARWLCLCISPSLTG